MARPGSEEKEARSPSTVVQLVGGPSGSHQGVRNTESGAHSLITGRMYLFLGVVLIGFLF